MNQSMIGLLIKELREKKGLTQFQLAELLSVSDKTVSKWETGRGYPDITLLEPIANVLNVSVTELLSGTYITNKNLSTNMTRSKFYICPICSNVIHSMGEAAISCHGIQLLPIEAEESDENHIIMIERVEDEYYIQIDHEMSKNHYISFIAGVGNDYFELVKLYPEMNAEARFKIRGLKQIYYYCNQDGLYTYRINSKINGREYNEFDYQNRKIAEKMMSLWSDLGDTIALGIDHPKVQRNIRKLHLFVSNVYYPCSKERFVEIMNHCLKESNMIPTIEVVVGKGNIPIVERALIQYLQ